MSSFNATMDISGLRAFQNAVDTIGGKGVRRVMRKALRAGAKPAIKIARSRLAPIRRTGLLSKSLGTKVITTKGDKTLIAKIGPRTGFRTQIGVFTRGKNAGKPKFANPVNYAHLVEFGTFRTKKTPFLRPAVDVGRPAIRTAIINKIAVELPKEVKKARVKAGKR